MLLDFFDRKIRESFSKAALEYDVLTSLHKEIGRELSKKIIDNDDVATILDVGMGTGWLTNRVQFYLPDSKMIGLDFAPGMTTMAKTKWPHLNIIQGNANCLPIDDDQMSLVISNLAYQWADNLHQAFCEVKRVLKPNGKMFITMFAQKTFQELFESLEQTNPKALDVPLRRLASKEDLEKSLQILGYQQFSVRDEYIKVRFPDMLGLLKWVKSIGANVLTPNTFLGKEWLKAANQYYADHYSDRLGIYSTFEVLWIEAHS